MGLAHIPLDLALRFRAIRRSPLELR